MYCDTRGTDKNHPGQNFPDKRPSDKTPGRPYKNSREKLRENLYRGLLSGIFVLFAGSQMLMVDGVWS